MADMVDRSGLILTDWASNMAQQQNQAYLQEQRRREAETYARNQAVENASNAARQQFAAGNVAGAQQTAAQGNAWDAWKAIDDTQKAQVAAQAADIGGAAYNLARLPKGQQRIDYFNSFVPTLRAHGMNDAEIQQYATSGFLDNDDALHGYADKAVGIANLWKADQDRIKAAYDRDTDLMKPVTAADGAVLVRGADGEYTPAYTPGTKPESQFIKNEDGSTSYVAVPGTPGTSYATGGDTSRVMNYEARAAGHAAVPDNVQTLGQFTDYARGLNGQGIKSSAAGTYQIVGRTMAQYAPRVLGADWRNQPFNSQTQDRVAQAIFEDNRGSTSALRSQWVSLSAQDAERIRHLPWSQAREVIAAGESGGSVRSASRGGIQVQNLGGGRSGPEWQDETREINGQVITGQRSQKTGEFRPMGQGVNKKAGAPADVEAQISNADNSLATIDRALKHPGLNAAFGLPSINPLDGNLFGKIVPGSPAADARALVETVKSQAFLAGIGQMKGQGALSDAEGAKISTAIANLSENQSDSQIRANLNVVRNMVETGKRRLMAKRQQATQQPRRVSNPAEYNSLPSGAQYYDPQGQLRRKR